MWVTSKHSHTAPQRQHSQRPQQEGASCQGCSLPEFLVSGIDDSHLSSPGKFPTGAFLVCHCFQKLMSLILAKAASSLQNRQLAQRPYLGLWSQPTT